MESVPPLSRDRALFGLDWITAVCPHYAAQPFSPLHRELAEDLRAITFRRGATLNRIAPRGFAKSTICSKMYPVYSIGEATESFILILSDSARQAKSFIRSIKRELETNRLFAARYPDAVGVGPIWQTDHIITRNGVEVMVAGGGGSIRGISSGERRPTLVIVDDANKKEDAYSADQRTKKLEWLNADILPIGEPGTNFVSVGTPIHREAIVCSLAERGWETKSYRSVIDWPTRMDLWHQWERLLTNLGDPRRKDTAATFYAANKAAMDAGATVLWPERHPLELLMTKRAQMGEQAFNSEYQDEPGTSGATEWPPEYFDAPDFWVPGLPVDRVGTVQALDPSKGRGDAPSDWQAHVVCTLGRDGLLYFDADLRREDATRMATRAADMADIWKPNALVVEDNGTMGLLAAEFHELQVKKGRLANVKLEILTSTDAKEFRIREVSPFLARRQVRVVNSTGGRELVRQWRQWPTADHDDAPDAAATALRRLLQAVG